MQLLHGFPWLGESDLDVFESSSVSSSGEAEGSQAVKWKKGRQTARVRAQVELGSLRFHDTVRSLQQPLDRLDAMASTISRPQLLAEASPVRRDTLHTFKRALSGASPGRWAAQLRRSAALSHWGRATVSIQEAEDLGRRLGASLEVLTCLDLASLGVVLPAAKVVGGTSQDSAAAGREVRASGGADREAESSSALSGPAAAAGATGRALAPLSDDSSLLQIAVQTAGLLAACVAAERELRCGVALLGRAALQHPSIGLSDSVELDGDGASHVPVCTFGFADAECIPGVGPQIAELHWVDDDAAQAAYRHAKSTEQRAGRPSRRRGSLAEDDVCMWQAGKEHAVQVILRLPPQIDGRCRARVLLAQPDLRDDELEACLDGRECGGAVWSDWDEPPPAESASGSSSSSSTPCTEVPFDVTIRKHSLDQWFARQRQQRSRLESQDRSEDSARLRAAAAAIASGG